MLTNKIYNILNIIASMILPTIGALYFVLSMTKGIPYGEQVVGTIVVLVLLLNIVLFVSSVKYNKPMRGVKPMPCDTEAD